MDDDTDHVTVSQVCTTDGSRTFAVGLWILPAALWGQLNGRITMYAIRKVEYMQARSSEGSAAALDQHSSRSTMWFFQRGLRERHR